MVKIARGRGRKSIGKADDTADYDAFADSGPLTYFTASTASWRFKMALTNAESRGFMAALFSRCTEAGCKKVVVHSPLRNAATAFGLASQLVPAAPRSRSPGENPQEAWAKKFRPPCGVLC